MNRAAASKARRESALLPSPSNLMAMDVCGASGSLKSYASVTATSNRPRIAPRIAALETLLKCCEPLSSHRCSSSASARVLLWTGPWALLSRKRRSVRHGITRSSAAKLPSSSWSLNPRATKNLSAPQGTSTRPPGVPDEKLFPCGCRPVPGQTQKPARELPIGLPHESLGTNRLSGSRSIGR